MAISAAPSSASSAIAQLEVELGAPLFEKPGRSITLTQLGEQFLHSVQQSLNTLDEGVSAVQRVARGEGVIRLGLLRLNLKILQLSDPVWERKFYLVSNTRTYEPPVVHQFRQFVLNNLAL